jgi:glucose/arabinose dehydrogenase
MTATILFLLLISLSLSGSSVDAAPSLKDSSLKVELVTDGLNSPTSMAFVEDNKILVLEKNSGEIRLVLDGILQNHSSKSTNS